MLRRAPGVQAVNAWSQGNPTDERRAAPKWKLKRVDRLVCCRVASAQFVTRWTRPVTAGSGHFVQERVRRLAQSVRGVEGFGTRRSWRETERSETERRGPRRGFREQRPRVITSSVGAELSPPTHGAHRVPIGWDSLPRKRTSFSPRLLFRFSSPPDLSRHSRQSRLSLSPSFSLTLALSLSFFPIARRVPATTRYSSLSDSRRSLGFHLCPSRESLFDTSRPCASSVLFLLFYVSSCPSFGEGPSRLPALVRLLNATRVDTLPCPKGDHSFRIPTSVTIVIEKRKTRRWMKRNCRKNRLTKKYIPNVFARRKAHGIIYAYKPSVIQISHQKTYGIVNTIM